MGVPIVVDEWLLHDLGGENGSKKQGEAMQFLAQLILKGDQIVILEGSPFEDKVKALKAQSYADTRIKAASRFLELSIIPNPASALILKPEHVDPLPQYLLDITPPEDQYLFQAYLSVRDRGGLILTTDNRWRENILKQKALLIRKRDEFLKEYLGG